MTAIATTKLKKSLADLDVPEVPEFPRFPSSSNRSSPRADTSGPAGCRPLTKEDLYDEVEDIIRAGDFIEKTEGAQMLFF